MSTDEQPTTLDDIAAQSAQTAADLRQLAGDVSELGGEQATHQDEIKRLDAGYRTLSGLVQEIADTVQAQQAEADDLTPVNWPQLDRELAEDEWRKLFAWFEQVAADYEIRRDQVPDCWTRHAAMRNELSWLRTAHRYAYSPSAVSGAAAEWHLRHLPGALNRITDHAKRPEDEAMRCADGSCRGELVHDPNPPISAFGEITRPEVWCFKGVEADLARRPLPTPAKTANGT